MLEWNKHLNSVSNTPWVKDHLRPSETPCGTCGLGMSKVNFSHWYFLTSDIRKTIEPATKIKEIEVLDVDSEDDQDSDN